MLVLVRSHGPDQALCQELTDDLEDRRASDLGLTGDSSLGAPNAATIIASLVGHVRENGFAVRAASASAVHERDQLVAHSTALTIGASALPRSRPRPAAKSKGRRPWAKNKERSAFAAANG